MTPDQIERYARHLMLKEIGGPGQNALLGARVALVGAGGLGGPAGLYLAAAGAGHLTLIDPDIVTLSNLQRQIQFGMDDIGAPKVSAMAARIAGLNPDVAVRAVQDKVSDDNAQSLLAGHDVIIDATDSFDSRFALNRAALALGTPLVSGAIGRFDGQVSVFGGDGSGPCYQCLVPSAPPHAASCAEVGVIGAIAGIIGSAMALETLKIITGAGTALTGRLWIFDGLAGQSRTVKLPKDPACPACTQNGGQSGRQ